MGGSVRAHSDGTIRFEAAVPQFSVPDVVEAAQYYRDAFGFQIVGYWDGERASFSTDPPPVFGIVKRDGVQVFFSRGAPSDTRRGRTAGSYDVYIHVAGVDALAAEFRDRGVEILDGPEDRSYHQRELVVRDCNGAILAFGEDTGAHAT